MLYYAKRINFEPEFVLPNFTVTELYREREKKLLNNKGQFFVQITEKHPYVKELVRQAQNLNLTVSGDGTAPVKGGDITQAQKGDQITFGSSSRFDMNWTKRDQYFCQNKYAPVYDIVKDWDKIEKALKQFAAQKKSTCYDGRNVRFHTRFMVVDGRAIPYEKNQIAILVPTTVLKDMLEDYDLIITGVRTIRCW